MEENFNPVARTRANYYTPGSPVQFVCVELLKGELSGENAVCLTFKNISKVTLTALEIHFKCKGVDGIILCEDAFEYREIEVKPGESFGMDDAVFVTQKAITSVDVVLKNVYSGKKVVLTAQKLKGVAVIYVGEDLDVLLELCDRILVLCGGQVSGIVDGRTTTKEEVGLLMTRFVKEAKEA